ncbi:hypothetical protein TARUN_7596 [Trichoderma arundinaceum]|uniref:Uncharacterized protein n=1 Tax=Trichoderma arundinaceum TaxID=490622 RepID=A0A395NFJ1_TRIAR|nr:hypothetical protein TARUN_7596 [Trichoderma arundinaceum]
MADTGSALKGCSFVQEQSANTSSSPSVSSNSSSSSSTFQDTPNEVPQEYYMAWPSPFAAQSFPFPPQQRACDPLPTFVHLQEQFQRHYQKHYDDQASLSNRDLPSSSSRLPGSNPHSSSVRLVREQRLSTCLNILRHIQRTLRQRHQEAELQLTRTSHLVVQTTWDLFSQSPLDFMCHKMDILTDSATTAILSEGGDVSRRHSLGDSEAWMKKLEELRDLRDDEYDAKERVGKIWRQIQCANDMMLVGLKEQMAALEGGDPMGFQYRGTFAQPQHENRAMAAPPDQRVGMESQNMAKPSEITTCAMSSTFLNWPLPNTPMNDEEAGINSSNNSSDASAIEGQCDEECCRHNTL